MDLDKERVNQHQLDASELAEIRTALALDRTLLSTIRTSLTLIGFGFTLAKFVHDMIENGALRGVQPGYPRAIGFALMGMGVLTLIGGAFQYLHIGKRLRKSVTSWSLPMIVNIALALVSVALIVSLLIDLSN